MRTKAEIISAWYNGDIDWSLRMRQIEVWTEGYQSSDGVSGAIYHGAFEANSLYDAALEAFGEGQVNLKDMTFWGCNIFDNEADARKRFG